MNNEYDILIAGGLLLTLSKNMDILEEPLIGIRDGRITLIESQKKTNLNRYCAKEKLYAADCLIMPGLINTHTHLPMVCFRGMADDLPLAEWLQEHIWPAEAKYVKREMVYAGSMLAMAEMIMSGTTTFCDAYFFESSVAEAAIASGMRGIVCQGFIDLPQKNESSNITAVAKRFIEKWQTKNLLLTPALACHAPYTCSPDTLSCVKEVAREANVPFTIHVSETKEEVFILKERYGKPPVAHLRDIGILDPKTVAVHCNWIDDEEIDIFRSFDVKVSHNPESSLKLAAGIAPIPKLMKSGLVIGLGTDGTASNNNLDLFGEMDFAAKIHKVSEMDPTVMDAKTVLKMATIDAARVLGLEEQTGSIEIGKCADIILVNMTDPHWIPLFNPYSQLVYAARGSDVVSSIIGGRIVMRDRRLLTMDLAQIANEVRNIAARIIKEKPSQSSGL